MLKKIFDRFVEKSPVSVMARGLVEKILNPAQLDEWFEQTASAEFVRYAAGEVTPLIRDFGGTQAPWLPGYRVKIVDGNCLEASEHRLPELRSLVAGALPGKSLVVDDPELRLPIDVFPCEDGHAQERSLLSDVLATVIAGDVWIADRNFCTRSFLCGIHLSEAFFIIRQHANLPWTSAGKERFIGNTESGKVFEQPILVQDTQGAAHRFRRIRVCLPQATRDGDPELVILTNLAEDVASASKISRLYRGRWTIETAFQELTTHVHSEINTLGYPPAALFGFCLALVAYMCMKVIRAALWAVHGIEKIETEVSDYYIADELAGTYRGMMIAIPDEEWTIFRQLTHEEFVTELMRLASKVTLSRFRKHPRGPKKPYPQKKADPKTPHVSTARLLRKRKRE